MTEPASPQVTQLLIQAQAGDPKALDAMLPVVYEELRRVALRIRRLRACRSNPVKTCAASRP